MHDRQSLPLATASPRASATLRNVRSTLICSGLVELRARGLYDRYLQELDPVAAPAIVGAIAGMWLPLETAMAHFAACDRIVPTDVAFEIGGSSGRRVQQSALATLVRLATGAGATPWTVFANYERLWSRIFDGGRVTVEKVGPKDAIIRHEGMALARFAYFRNAIRGANDGALRLFAPNLFVRELPQFTTATTMRYRCAWV